jgi:hypothetical protein
MTTFVSDDDVQRALDFLRDSAAEMGELTRVAYLSEGYVKHVIALEMKKVDGPANAQEREARASDAYFNAIRTAANNAGELAKMKALREAASAKIEAWRTASSNFRSMKL